MRKLALLAMFYCAFSYAADRWLEMPNNAGGKIMLFNTKCSGTDDGKMVIATTPQGTNVTGCWWYFAEMVHVVWKTGDTSSFDVNSFKIREGK